MEGVGVGEGEGEEEALLKKGFFLPLPNLIFLRYGSIASGTR